jgi:hypothetical protein
MMNSETAEITVVLKTVLIFQCNGNQSFEDHSRIQSEIPCVLNIPQAKGYVQNNCVRNVFVFSRNILHGRNKKETGMDIRKRPLKNLPMYSHEEQHWDEYM